MKITSVELLEDQPFDKFRFTFFSEWDEATMTVEIDIRTKGDLIAAEGHARKMLVDLLTEALQQIGEDG